MLKPQVFGRAASLRSLLALFLAGSVLSSMPAHLCAADGEFIRGDANMDRRVTLADVFKIIRFLTGSPVDCKSAGDANDDGDVDTIDVVFFLDVLFTRAYAIVLPPPFEAQGVDPTPDGLGCEQGLTPLGAGGEGEINAAGPELKDALDSSVDCDPPHGAGADLEFIHLRGGQPVVAYPGETGIRVPIHYFSAGGVEGVTISLRANPASVRLDSIDFAEAKVVKDLDEPPAWTDLYDGKRDDGYLTASLALSITPPVRTFPQLPGAPFAFLEFSIDEGAEIGTVEEIRFRHTPGENGLPAIENEVSRQGNAQGVVSCGLSVHIVSSTVLFVRGDASRDRQLDITDAIGILGYAFSGVSLRCPDAGDVNDDGIVDLTDAISLLTFLFRGGAATSEPAPPFPMAGEDPTPGDTLPCESAPVAG